MGQKGVPAGNFFEAFAQCFFRILSIEDCVRKERPRGMLDKIDARTHDKD